jgi:hypothetical protein
MILTTSKTTTATPQDSDFWGTNKTLRSIEVVADNADMAATMLFWGNLGHFKALKMIALHFNNALNEDADDDSDEAKEWSKLDKIFAQTGNSLAAVNIYAFLDEHTERMPNLRFIRSVLPSVAGNFCLYPADHIYSV